MQLSLEDMAALSGETFISNYHFKPEFDEKDKQYLTRRSILKELCADKNIIHLGCVDHNIEMITEKLKRGKWLHDDLVNVSKRCLGIDLNKTGLDYIEAELGIKDLLCQDIIENDASEILDNEWDYFLIPEVLEHQDNPVWFMSKLREKYAGNVSQFVITVPNAFDLQNQKTIRKNREEINSDHRFWFSPYTLSKVLVKAGFTDITLRMSRNGKIKKRAALKNLRLAQKPFLRNNIIAIAS